MLNDENHDDERSAGDVTGEDEDEDQDELLHFSGWLLQGDN